MSEGMELCLMLKEYSTMVKNIFTLSEMDFFC